jgi:hypothetical protein
MEKIIDYQSWRKCIEIDCGIKLTPSFCRQRIKLLNNSLDSDTQKFIKLYGRVHRDNVITWFKKHLEENEE